MDTTKNLIPGGHPGAYKLTREEQQAGGRASAKVRKEKADLKKCLQNLLAEDITTTDGKKMSGAEAMCVKLFKKALSGDTRAWELLRDTAGQKPKEEIEQTINGFEKYFRTEDE